MKKYLRTCGHCARCARCMFSHAGVLCRNYKPSPSGDDITIDKAFVDDAPAPAEERVDLVDYLDKTAPAGEPIPESVGVLDITKKNFFVLDREGGFYGGARTLQGAKQLVWKILERADDPAFYDLLDIFRAEDTVDVESIYDNDLIVMKCFPRDGAVPVDDAVLADESLEDNGFALLSCWGNNTNTFYDPERSYNGGGYWQPSGGCLFAVHGRLVVVSYDKFDCGDFGCRRDYVVECDGFRWAWSESNMDGDSNDYCEAVYNSISGVLGVDADWFLDVARDAVQFAASATWDSRDDGAESAV